MTYCEHTNCSAVATWRIRHRTQNLTRFYCNRHYLLESFDYDSEVSPIPRTAPFTPTQEDRIREIVKEVVEATLKALMGDDPVDQPDKDAETS